MRLTSFASILFYFPCINDHLEQWKGAWINHSIRTADNLSPLQLWMEGMFRVQANEDIGNVPLPTVPLPTVPLPTVPLPAVPLP